MLSLALTSVVKARFLQHLLGSSVSPLRRPLVSAVGAAVLVGWAFTLLPHRLEWIELAVGIPAIAGVYLYILWRYAFGEADRALFARAPQRMEQGGAIASEGVR